MTFLVDGTLGGTFPSWTTATRPASPAVGQMGYNTTTGLFDQYVSGAWQSISTGTGAVPQVTTYTSSSGTYTTPAGAKYLQVFMVGGGGGGAGGSVNLLPGAAGGTGGNTTFGTSLLTCNGGAGAAGGSATIGTGPVGMAFSGGRGFTYSYNSASVTNYLAGGNGASTPFSGGGAGGSPVSPGNTPTANSGAGGGGGSSGNSNDIGGSVGGGAGGYINAIISSPSSTYSYAIGAGGTGGAAGSGSAAAGGAGAAGVIYVYAYF